MKDHEIIEQTLPEVLNAILEAQGAIVQILCRRLPPAQRVAVGDELRQLAQSRTAAGERIAGKHLLDLAAAADRTRDDATGPAH